MIHDGMLIVCMLEIFLKTYLHYDPGYGPLHFWYKRSTPQKVRRCSKVTEGRIFHWWGFSSCDHVLFCRGFSQRAYLTIYRFICVQ